MPFFYLDDFVQADVAFRASGGTLEELFKSAWDATLSILVEDLESVRLYAVKAVDLRNREIDLLLYEFLELLVFYKDADSLLLRVASLEIQKRGEVFTLMGKLSGEKIDFRHHRLGVDVKAVTMHKFEVVSEDGRWHATVVLDV